MTDPRAQEIIDVVYMLSNDFGIPVTISRIVPSTEAATPIPIDRNIFGTQTNSQSLTFNVNVIIESQKLNDMPTLVGQKPKEEIRFITIANSFKLQDEVLYGGKKYRVEHVEPVPFVGSDVVDFVRVFREVG